MRSLTSLAFNKLPPQEALFVWDNYCIDILWERGDEFFDLYKKRDISNRERLIEILTYQDLDEYSLEILEERAYIRESLLRGEVGNLREIPFTVNFIEEFLPFDFHLCNIHNLCQYLKKQYLDLVEEKAWEGYEKKLNYYNSFLSSYTGFELYLSQFPLSSIDSLKNECYYTSVLEIRAIKGDIEAEEELQRRGIERTRLRRIHLAAGRKVHEKTLESSYDLHAAAFSGNCPILNSLSKEDITEVIHHSYLGYMLHRDIHKFLSVLEVITKVARKISDPLFIKSMRCLGDRSRGLPVDVIDFIDKEIEDEEFLFTCLRCNFGYLTTIKYILRRLSPLTDKTKNRIKKILAVKGKYFPKTKKIIEEYLEK